MFKNNKILVLGMARSGYEVSKYLSKRDNEIILNDGGAEAKQDPNKIKELKDLGVKLIFGHHPDDLLDESFDYVIKNPGIKNDHKMVKQAESLNIPVLNEVEVAYRLLPKDVTLVGITGTNGKTTTTTLTYNILHDYFGDRVHLAGNIGYPLISILDSLKSNDIIVMEVSCQQSVNFVEFKPHIALVTNFSPAHIDFFDGSFDKYMETKCKMFRNQNKEDIAIINYNNSNAMKKLKDIKSQKKYFSSKEKCFGTYLENNKIYYNDEEVMATAIIKIPGLHNLENIMGAISIAKEFNVPNESIQKTISNFKGVEHRLEYVSTKHGVKFYNDTEATNIKCTQIALASFKEPIIIILGGLERGQDFNDLVPYIKNVKAIIGIGECRERVKDFGKKVNINTYIYEHLKDGFKKITEIMQDGDVVLLSPASASWDQYKECEIRGQEFKDLVNNIK